MNTLKELKDEFLELNWQADIYYGLEGCKLLPVNFDRMAAEARIEELKEILGWTK